MAKGYVVAMHEGFCLGLLWAEPIATRIERLELSHPKSWGPRRFVGYPCRGPGELEWWSCFGHSLGRVRYEDQESPTLLNY